MKITIELEERDIETIMYALEAEAAHKIARARESHDESELRSATAHGKRLNRIRQECYRKVLESHFNE